MPRFRLQVYTGIWRGSEGLVATAALSISMDFLRVLQRKEVSIGSCGSMKGQPLFMISCRAESSPAMMNLYWADSGDLVAIASDASFYILKFNRNVVSSYLDGGKSLDEQGVEDAFELLYEINEHVRTGLWVRDSYIYNNSSWRLNYSFGGEVTTMYDLDNPMYLLGYLASQSWVFLIDREFNIIEYKTLVMHGVFERAKERLPSIPKEHHNSVAHFLESRGMLEDALEVAIDPDYRFKLAIQLGRLDIAKQIAREVQSESKWKQLGALAFDFARG